jgi:protoheme IX farnesyltransferase
MKPQLAALLLLATLSAMLAAGDSGLSLRAIVLTSLGGFLAAGGAGALNDYLDRELDGLMNSTRRRPIPEGRIAPRQALRFGLLASGAAFLLLWWGANLLAACLALAGSLVYVLVYSYWLKRRSPQHIAIAGAAGAFPPLVGWAAATGELSPAALLLGAIVFCWVLPHFWTQAFVLQKEYARAGLPLLPAAVGNRAVCLQIALYAAGLVLLTLLPAVLGLFGFLYTEVAFLAGGILLFYALRLQRSPNSQAAWRLHQYSQLYLGILFFSMVADRLLLQ